MSKLVDKLNELKLEGLITLEDIMAALDDLKATIEAMKPGPTALQVVVNNELAAANANPALATELATANANLAAAIKDANDKEAQIAALNTELQAIKAQYDALMGNLNIVLPPLNLPTPPAPVLA